MLEPALAWLAKRLFDRAEPLAKHEHARETIYVFPERETLTIEKPRPAYRLETRTVADFAAALANLTPAAGLLDPTPIIFGQHKADVITNVFDNSAVVLHYQIHPAYAALAALKPTWQSQRDAYELARYTLAPILGDQIADRISTLAYKTDGRREQVVGNSRDRGLREFMAEPTDPAWAKDRIAATVDCALPSDNLAEPFRVDVELAIETRYEDDEPKVRIYPTPISLQLAALELARRYRDAVAEALAEADEDAARWQLVLR